jgi:uncharacterized protein YcfL
MRNLVVLSLTVFGLAACGSAPSEESPVAPDVVCETPIQADGDSAEECRQFEEEIAGDVEHSADGQSDGENVE